MSNSKIHLAHSIAAVRRAVLFSGASVALLAVAGCGGSTSSGASARFNETNIVFRNLGSDIECNSSVVERGANTDGSTWARCTWPCGVNGPRKVERHFYVRNWRRETRNQPYVFTDDRVEDSICR